LDVQVTVSQVLQEPVLPGVPSRRPHIGEQAFLLPQHLSRPTRRALTLRTGKLIAIVVAVSSNPPDARGQKYKNCQGEGPP